MTGKQIRFSKLFGGGRNGALVALDHGAEFGPTPGLIDFRATLEKLRGADGILLNPGMLDASVDFFARPDAPKMIVRVTWTTAYCFPWNYHESQTALLMSAADALARGADFIMACCLVQTGSEALDRDNVKLFAEVVAQKEKTGVPLIGELYPVGAEEMPAAELHDRVFRGARILAELGADAIKTFYTGERFAEVVEGCPVPILVLGASKAAESEALAKARTAITAGARGVVFGRNVFQAKEPATFLKSLAQVVHDTGRGPRQLQMVWPQDKLREIPAPALPTGYARRQFRAGDEAEYTRLMSVAGFEGWTPGRIADLLQRVVPGGFFVIEHKASRRLVATATALHRPREFHPFGGELGWVAGDPEHKGKGLGFAVCAAVASRLAEAGYTHIYLLTDDHRLPALAVYLKLGFAPYLIEPEMKARWNSVLKQLGMNARKVRMLAAE